MDIFNSTFGFVQYSTNFFVKFRKTLFELSDKKKRFFFANFYISKNQLQFFYRIIGMFRTITDVELSSFVSLSVEIFVLNVRKWFSYFLIFNAVFENLFLKEAKISSSFLQLPKLNSIVELVSA